MQEHAFILHSYVIVEWVSRICSFGEYASLQNRSTVYFNSSYTYCTESPARSTFQLVLDFQYSVLFSPVDRVWSSPNLDMTSQVLPGHWPVLESEHGSEFFGCQICELIDSHGEGFKSSFIAGIVCVDFFYVVLKNLETDFFFIEISIRFSMIGL